MNNRTMTTAALAAAGAAGLLFVPAQAQAPSELNILKLETKIGNQQGQIAALQAQVRQLQALLRAQPQLHAGLPSSGFSPFSRGSIPQHTIPKYTIPQYTIPSYSLPDIQGLRGFQIPSIQPPATPKLPQPCLNIPPCRITLINRR